MSHAPVLLAEAMDALALADGGLYVDATFGGGGYSREMLSRADCRVVAFDRDPDAIVRGAELSESAKGKFTLHQGRFGDLSLEQVDGVVFDLGVSSFQLDEAERGFSFQADADLDMRMEKDGLSAADAVNRLSEGALADLIYRYGEDDDSRRIARAIVQARAAAPITRTLHFAKLVEDSVGGRRGARTHPATKTFQALRMLVNDELGELARGLSAAERALKPGGRLVVVSFHSLEDRMVKHFITERADAQGRGSRYAPDLPPERTPSFSIDRKRATVSSDAETAANPRARSASLRWATRTDAPAWDELEPPALAPRAEAEWQKLQ
ncbi:16S rRNA (cytosine(1402)-N(4))-methyltransferase RsmH [Candidatus Viadribacter manganicus]|uniref:Ribosomal RNA small subunit methyltransferase H n=1 Tax=Candidatus Viadribacter manganicus TaxID=1759059 RepID=A0A1B1AKX5_9PROT|nr:16S rRNA (cytosine(1402)-N(4))-methyltransferase RsmH [Candidatus Viadribacter manganicus]ANP47195.1 ribosomal RNA small subunit methyltransferase H [Candidatus Viadribacter manganicus]